MKSAYLKEMNHVYARSSHLEAAYLEALLYTVSRSYNRMKSKCPELMAGFYDWAECPEAIFLNG